MAEVGLGKQRGRKGVGEGKLKSNVSQDLPIQSMNLGNGSVAQEGIKGYYWTGKRGPGGEALLKSRSRDVKTDNYFMFS